MSCNKLRFSGLRQVSLGLLAALVGLWTARADAVVVQIDNLDADFQVVSGTWGVFSSGLTGNVKGGYATNNNGPNTDSVRYNLSAGPGFVAGTYDVYAEWGTHVAHSPSARYTVNHTGGATPIAINYTQSAAQGAANTVLPQSPGGSGLRYLGTFSLDNASNIVVSSTAPGVGYLTPSSVMLRSASDGRIIDNMSDRMTVNVNGATLAGSDLPTGPGTGLFGESPSGGYTAYTNSAIYTWKPQYAGDGLYNIKASYQVYSTHSSNVTYLVDLNGDGIQNGADVVINSNQTLAANGTANGNGYWSGFLNLGTFNLTAASQIIQRNNGGTQSYITAAPMLATFIAVESVPEPGSITLFGCLAGLALLRRCRREK